MTSSQPQRECDCLCHRVAFEAFVSCDCPHPYPTSAVDCYELTTQDTKEEA